MKAHSIIEQSTKPSSKLGVDATGSLSDGSTNTSSPCGMIMRTPESSASELASQLAAMRAELRDGRLVQARQRAQINQDANRIHELEAKLYTSKQSREDLFLKLKDEQNVARSAEKRLEVAVANHTSAVEQCVSLSADTEKLRRDKKLVEKELLKHNGRLEARLDQYGKQILQMEDQLREMEGKIGYRDSQIKTLQAQLKRQCETNAMFKVDYSRDTNFVNTFNVPVAAQPSSSPSGENRQHSTTRTPLSSVRANQHVGIAKRARGAQEGGNTERLKVKFVKLEVDEVLKPRVIQSQPNGGYSIRSGRPRSILKKGTTSVSKDM